MATTDLRPGDTLGGYRIEDVAGRGGMGVVYRAIQIGLDRRVALKLLAAELAGDDAFRGRFQRESRLLASIDHPNVITVHEAGEHEGSLFIAMRYVEGTDLAALVTSEGGLDRRRATALLAQVGAALDAAHARGLVHRDVKPANVLIEQREGGEHAYLTDFGLTKAVASTAGALTKTGQFLGTVDFIAPEQARGQRVDARTDVYSLGCVLYTVLAGRVPFERDNQVARIFAHLNDPAPSLLDVLPDAPPELDAVVRRAMEKDPDLRFPSAGDLARAAAAAAAGDTPSAPERTVAAGDAAPAAEPAAAPAPPAAVAPPPGPRPPSPAGASPALPADPPSAPGHGDRRARWGLAAAAALAAVVVAVVLLSGADTPEDDSDALTAVLRPARIAVSGSPEHLAVGEGEIWVASTDGGSVTPIEPDGKKGMPIPVGMHPGAVAAGEGVVLVSTDDASAIFRIDADNRTRVGSPVPAQLQTGGDLAYGDGGFWAAMADGTVGRIDAGTGRVVATVPVPEPGSDGKLAVGAGAVWVVASADSPQRSVIFRIDAQTRKVTDRLDLGRGSFAAGLAFGEGALWIPDVGRNRLLRVDPATNRVSRTTEVSDGITSDDIAVADGAVWLSTHDPGRMLWFDPADGALAQAAPVETTETSELVVGLGSAWLSAPEDGSVTRLAY